MNAGRGVAHVPIVCASSNAANKVDGKPSPAIDGLRATLHPFFPTPEKSQEPKTVDDEDDEDSERAKEEEARREEIDNSPRDQGCDEDENGESE